MLGSRVVRGPDWKWGTQDNGEGHVGTIVEVGKAGSTSSPEKTVVVQWDTGSRTNYRVGYQEAYDLRLWDNAPAGIHFQNVICDGCKDHGVAGMLYKCLRCVDFDLCSICYMNDIHDLDHPFLRFESPNIAGVELPPREGSPKIVSKGIFSGSRISRGPDWDWGDQDMSDGKKCVGRVVDIRGWDSESGRSVANVVWAGGSTNVYRLGHKGKVDLKCVQPSSGGSYYPQHLPIIGMPSVVRAPLPVPQSSSEGATTSSSTIRFMVGERVCVSEERAKLRDAQEGHGGYNPRMADYIGKRGVVHRVTDKGDIRVQYENNIRWTFNPICVSKIKSYSVGDGVLVSEDMAKVRELQKGHGEWVDLMKDILGKRGKVVKIYSDNDLRINFGSTDWTMNPGCVTLVAPADRSESNNSMYATTHTRSHPNSQESKNLTEMLPALMDQLSTSETFTVERFVREAAQGRVENVRMMLGKMKERINEKNSGKTPLQVAGHQGHVEIVSMLIGAGANLEVADDEGDVALHYTAFGNQPGVMEFLLKAGSLVNAVNRGQCSALHVAVNKQFLECVKVLLKFKCNVNLQDSYGDTALHDAIGKEHKEIIDCLINTPGVDFTLKNNRGFNVIHHSSLKGNHYALEKLLGKGRELVDVKKDDGFSALHLACLNGHWGVAKALLEEGGAQIDIRNNRKQTPLALAVSQGYSGLVEYLIGKGAAVGAEDEDGDTPLMVCLQKHFESSPGQNPLSTVTPNASQELRKVDNAPIIAEICTNLLSRGWSESDGDLGGSMLACFLVRSGADLTKKNRRGVCGLDLIKSERLKETLAYYLRLRAPSHPPHRPKEGEHRHKPPSVPLPPLPNTSSSHPGPSECMLCSELLDLVTFEPCHHTVVCEECCVRMKKCVKCQTVIVKKISGGGRPVRPPNQAPSERDRLRYLEHKFAEIEETYCCGICMERRRSVAFLCGHGACERCSEALKSCHMCRSPITQKINLY